MNLADRATAIAALREHGPKGLVPSSETLQFFTRRQIEDALRAAGVGGSTQAEAALKRFVACERATRAEARGV